MLGFIPNFAAFFTKFKIKMSTREYSSKENNSSSCTQVQTMVSVMKIVNIVKVKEHAQDFYVSIKKLILSVVTDCCITDRWLQINTYVEQGKKLLLRLCIRQKHSLPVTPFASALDSPGGGAEGFASIAENYGGTKQEIPPSYMLALSAVGLGKYESHLNIWKIILPVTR